MAGGFSADSSRVRPAPVGTRAEGPLRSSRPSHHSGSRFRGRTHLPVGMWLSLKSQRSLTASTASMPTQGLIGFLGARESFRTPLAARVPRRGSHRGPQKFGHKTLPLCRPSRSLGPADPKCHHGSLRTASVNGYRCHNPGCPRRIGALDVPAQDVRFERAVAGGIGRAWKLPIQALTCGFVKRGGTERGRRATAG
jgi:hypothetical protein